eukprot:CAMPEP_0114647796 /NCGR_PEP_ID=MMETSP0191-20121206/5982_1 /TAXON_ID=126664 /ORGANISM="Sorites sp." /LENGTH=140 /DNA_ID=CAMNT_0001860929 /DNA_START=188 /DNA_END=611 /DNA_ORIENTATION=-
MTETAGHVFPGAPAMAMATRRTIANWARGALLPIEHGHGAGPLRNLDLNLVQLTAIGWLVIDVGRQRRPIISTHAVPVLFDEVPFRPNPNIIAMILEKQDPEEKDSGQQDPEQQDYGRQEPEQNDSGQQEPEQNDPGQQD